MAYSKIRQPKLSDVIEQQLEYLILEGTLRPGEKLPPERELAKQFDVSRPSLREAIQRLEAKGLLLRRQGGGTFVQTNLWQSFSDPLAELLADHPESQFDLLETRHALEGIAAYYAALRGTDEDLARIRDCHIVTSVPPPGQPPKRLRSSTLRTFPLTVIGKASSTSSRRGTL
ncbi:GntR family transcriptional regulator [Streptomyces sp. NPDC047968]|uniref:GntR family transcriptional regulator n=1 Tax=Streptomyces sp. NPDC047968 TaxID=3155382 RepID=UPI0034279BB6